MSEQAYPLSWPLGWARAKYRTGAAFRHQKGSVPLDVAIRRLEEQLEKLGAKSPVLSTNHAAGLLRSQPNPTSADPGAAIYFTLKEKRLVLACDRWARLPDNIVAIASHIDALRGQERWGVGSIEQAFSGYTALENFSKGVPWRRVLGFKDDQAVSLEMAEGRFKELAMKHHPDRGGDKLQMQQIGEAIAEARKQLRQAA